MAVVDELDPSRRFMLCVVFGIIMGTQVNIAKELTLTFEPSYIIFIRSISFLVTMPFVEWDEVDNYRVVDLALYILASVVGIIPFGTMVVSLEFIGAGDSNAIEFGASLILTGVFGHFVLKEKISFLYLAMLIVNSVGVTLVAKPHFIFGDDKDEGEAVTSREVGAVFAFIGAFFCALWPILTRSLVTRDNLHCFILAIMHGWAGVVLAGIWCTSDSSWVMPETWTDLALLISYGFTSNLQIIFAVKIVQNAAAVDFAVAMTISVVLSYGLQVTLFGENVDLICVLGAVIVIVCVFLSAFWENLGAITQKHLGLEQQPDISPEEERVNLVKNDD